MVKYKVIDRNGESFCDFHADGSIFVGYDSREEAEYLVECLKRRDDKYGIDNDWIIVEV